MDDPMHREIDLKRQPLLSISYDKTQVSLPICNVSTVLWVARVRVCASSCVFVRVSACSCVQKHVFHAQT